MYTLVGTFFIQSSGKFVSKFIFLKSRLRLKLGHVGSEIRSLDPIIENFCAHSRGHSFDLNFMKLCPNAHLQKNI